MKLTIITCLIGIALSQSTDTNTESTSNKDNLSNITEKYDDNNAQNKSKKIQDGEENGTETAGSLDTIETTKSTNSNITMRIEDDIIDSTNSTQITDDDIICDESIFPTDDFKAHSDKTKVYLKPAKFEKNSVFGSAGLTKYTTVFGLHIVVDSSVTDKQLVHLTNVYANLLDQKNEGKPTNEHLVEILRNNSATLFVMKDLDRIKKLMIEDGKDSLPKPLQRCPIYFDFEESSRIVPNGKHGDATCTTGDDNEFDRSVPFVLDHLFGRGFDAIFDKDEQKRIYELMLDSVTADTFDISNSGCPLDHPICSSIMYTSWAMTSYYNYDKCWCKNANALKLCDKDSIVNGEPDLIEILSKKFKNPEKAAEKPYKIKKSD